MLLFREKIHLLTEDLHLIFLFYMLPFISLALSLFSIFICGIPFVEFYPFRAGRMINIAVYLIFFLYFIDKKNRKKINTKQVVDFYLKGCYILLFFGIWQLLNALFNVPYPAFETRDYIHTIDETMLPAFIKIRVTSIAREPAYLVPYLMDAIILLFYTRKKIPLFLCILISFFTLSASMYVNLFSIALVVFFFTKLNRYKVISVVVLLPCLIYLFFQIQSILIPVLNRLSYQNLLQEYRIRATLQPINFMFTEASLFNFIFGFGPKGIEYISRQSTQEIIIDGHVVIADWFVEYGIVGVLVFISLFLYLYRIGKMTYNITKNRLAQVMCINLFITGLFRSDYASPRYTIIFLLILFIYKDARTKIIYE
jgi:hypothetical protein